MAGREHEDRRRPIEDVAGRDLARAVLAQRLHRAGNGGSFLRMEKIVPTLTQTSRFDEPSSGSKTTQYLPPSTPRFRMVGSSFSSEATHAIVGRLPRHCIRMSLAMTSSFCCDSPCTFASPASPSTSSMRARRTLAAMALAASDRADSIQVNSPVAPRCCSSPCRMCDCSEVMFRAGIIEYVQLCRSEKARCRPPAPQ